VSTRSSRLSIGYLIRIFWRRVSVTWSLTLMETVTLAVLPLLIGRAIDGLLAGDWAPFHWLVGTMSVLLVLAVGRRIYDTRAYGAIRIAFGAAVVERAKEKPVSAINARLDMGREIVEFLETEAPVVLTAVVQLAVSIAVLYSFHGTLAAAAGGAAVIAILIYGASSRRFFSLNRALNQQVEKQVTVLKGGVAAALRHHLSALRRHEVRLSDTEAVVYGLIFAVLLAMLSFNLWFAATQVGTSPGQIFSIVAYSFEFIESAVILPAALQSLTRISEITQRING